MGNPAKEIEKLRAELEDVQTELATANELIALAKAQAENQTFGGRVAEGMLLHEVAPHLDTPPDGYGVYFTEREGSGDVQYLRYVGRDLAHAVGYAARYGTADFTTPPHVTLREANGAVTIELESWNELNALAQLVRDGGRIEMRDGGHLVGYPSLFAATADPS
jgi:hypothetical protein